MYPAIGLTSGQPSTEDALSAGIGRMQSYLARKKNPMRSTIGPMTRGEYANQQRQLSLAGSMPNESSYNAGVGSSWLRGANRTGQMADAAVEGRYPQRLGIDEIQFGRRFVNPSNMQPTAPVAPPQRDQYGLRTPLGQGNIQPEARHQSGYGEYDQLPPGVLGAPKTQSQGYLGGLGGDGNGTPTSEVYRIGGRNVVMGGGTLENYRKGVGDGLSPEDAYSWAKKQGSSKTQNGAEVRAEQYNMANPAYAAMRERQMEDWQTKMQDKSALRSFMRNKRLGINTEPPSLGQQYTPRGSVLSQVPRLSSKPDVAKRQADASRDALASIGPDEFSHLGLSGIHDWSSVNSPRVWDMMTSENFNNMSPAGKQKFNDFLQHYLNVTPESSFLDPRKRRAMEGYLKGDRHAIRKHEKEMIDDLPSYENIPIGYN